MTSGTATPSSMAETGSLNAKSVSTMMMNMHGHRDGGAGGSISSVPPPATTETHERYGCATREQENRFAGKYDHISSLAAKSYGDSVVVRARLHAVRTLGQHLVFLVLRQQGDTVQAVVHDAAKSVQTTEAAMVRWSQHIPTESIVLVQGRVLQPSRPVKGASLHDRELEVERIHIITERRGQLAFSVYDAEISRTHREHRDHDSDHASSDAEHEDDDSAAAHKKELSSRSSGSASGTNTPKHHHELPHLHQRLRLNNRVLDLRTSTSLAIFKVQAAVQRFFRAYLDARGFIEIHSPKLQGTSAESGASVFKMPYFGRDACLAQSPQLAKQMAIAADFGRVYEIGPVFRAENSNTPRHLCEFTGVDLEMEIGEYHEALNMIDGCLKNIFERLRDELKAEREIVKTHYPHEDLVWLPETPVLKFAEGVRLLVESGWREEDGSIPKETDDLSTRAEIRLGALIKEKYKTDFYILDKFPRSVRPFYTHPDPDDPTLSRSFDIFVRGQEIISGGQRIHNLAMLEKNLRDNQIGKKGLREYLEAFRVGAPPHAGCGLGLERFVMLYLGLDDIRLASLFHRDPKSLPVDRTELELNHPEASTYPPPWKAAAASAANGSAKKGIAENGVASATTPAKELAAQHQLQPLDELIANYGDSANTSWMDRRYTVWREPTTGSAVGYVKSGHYATLIGDPLCHPSQTQFVVKAFLKHLKHEAKLKPVWTMATEHLEDILVSTLGWRSLSCIQEDRIPTSSLKESKHDPDLERKVRHAKKEGVRIEHYGYKETVPDEVVREVEDRIQQWHIGRTGKKQAHMSDVTPFKDMHHRIYFFARDREGKVAAAVVLARLSAERGWQIKWALDFDSAPHGTIEMTVVKAIESVGSAGISFGASATERIASTSLGKGLAFKTLAAAYKSVAKRYHLTNKGAFRQKFGVVPEPLYIVFPGRGLSPNGMKSVIDTFAD